MSAPGSPEDGMKHPFADSRIEAAFDLSDHQARSGLLKLRDLILDTAQDLPEAGRIEEVLRWGQPSYITPETRTGSTLRLGVPKQGRFALFVHCQSRLIPEFLEAFPAWDRIEGTRAVLFEHPDEVEPMRHGWLIARALIYKIRKPMPKPD
jgi:hypothetical protein